MDAFNKIPGRQGLEKKQPYQYVNQSDVQPYWDIASQYGSANAMFSTQGSGSFTAHQDLIRGGTEIGGNVSLVDDPTASRAWGCDSPKGTKTSLITTSLAVEPDRGGFYDPVAPPTQDDQGGPGFRVPMLVISPYVPAGEISQTVYGFGSIIKFVEDTFKLKCLGTTDCSSTSIADMFNIKQKVRAFKPIRSTRAFISCIKNRPDCRSTRSSADDRCRKVPYRRKPS
jgi:hypothetical protein